MSEKAEFKINLRSGEIEISGSEEFVEKRISNLKDIIALVSVIPTPTPPTPSAAAKLGPDMAPQPNSDTNGGTGLPETFGEWMHSFNADVNDLQKALITARFVQAQSASNDFKTAEVNKSLKDHGVKLSNPSRSLVQLAEKKYIFQTRKVGKLKYMRVSTDGQKHLDSLKRQEG